MALPATDAFTDTNGTTLTDHDSSWVWHSKYAGSFMEIQSNALDMAGGGGDIKLYGWEADTFSDDQYSEATLINEVNGTEIGVAVRVSESACTAYIYEADLNETFFAKVIAGTWTDLGSTGGGWDVNDVVRIEAEGTTITPYVNSVVDSGVGGAATDSSISSGNAGVCGYGSGSTSRIDDWEGGDLGGGDVNFTATGAGATSTPTDAMLARSLPFTATGTGAAVTPTDAMLARSLPFTATGTGAAVTPVDAMLGLSRPFVATGAGATSTPDDAGLVLAVGFTATGSGATATPDDAGLILAVGFTATGLGAAVTPTDAMLAQDLAFAATGAGATATPDDAVFVLARNFTATGLGATSTPDNAMLARDLAFARR
jgi:hypothetical protein